MSDYKARVSRVLYAMFDPDEDKRAKLRIFFVCVILVTVAVGGGLAIATLVVNQNLSSLQRVAVVATAGDTGSGSTGVARGELSLETAEERIRFRFQHRGLSSAITSVYIMGPVAPGATLSATRAVTLCGAPCSVACDITSVANQVSGELLQTCDASTSLLPIITSLRKEPTRFYVQINTGNFPGATDNGELQDYLVRLIGSPL